MAISADALHYRSDLLVNTAVIVALILSAKFGMLIADPLLALLVAIYILISAKEIFLSSYNTLIDRELPDADRQRIREIALRQRAGDQRPSLADPLVGSPQLYTVPPRTERRVDAARGPCDRRFGDGDHRGGVSERRCPHSRRSARRAGAARGVRIARRGDDLAPNRDRAMIVGDQGDVIAFLSRPETYGGGASAVERIETHIGNLPGWRARLQAEAGGALFLPRLRRPSAGSGFARPRWR